MTVDSLPNQKVVLKKYNHSALENKRKILRFFLRVIGFNFLAKLQHVEGLENVPEQGPAILMINHIAFIDPIVVLHVMPRNIVPLAKVEVYDYPVVGIFPRIWGVIPVRREEFDRRAVQQVLDVLQAGEIVLVAPEGTRSPSLTLGKQGVAFIGVRSGVPVVPVAIDGTIGFPALRFTKAWRQPGAVVKFGQPFRFRSDLKHPDRQELRKMTDEAMYILAGMLPPQRRGVYSDISHSTQDTIEWL
jgi:1-acyl-sn-glycerol-3-phosphate acyltransferase